MDLVKNLFILEYSPLVDIEDLAFQMMDFAVLRIASFPHPEKRTFIDFKLSMGLYAFTIVLDAIRRRKIDSMESRNHFPFLDHSS